MPNYQLAYEVHRGIIRKSKEKKFIHVLETIFGLLVLLICNHQANTTEELDIYCVQLICLGHNAWVVPLKDKRGVNIVNVFQRIISKNANQIKYALVKVVNLRIIFSKDF